MFMTSSSSFEDFSDSYSSYFSKNVHYAAKGKTFVCVLVVSVKTSISSKQILFIGYYCTVNYFY